LDFRDARVEENKVVVWIVGSGGIVLRSPDGGRSWTRQDAHTDESLNSIWATGDGQTVWAAGSGGALRRTENNGAEWEEVRIPFHDDLGKIMGTPDGRELWIAGNRGMVLQSTDYGQGWRAIPILGGEDHLYSIVFSADFRQAWASGDGKLARTRDSGEHWSAIDLKTSSSLMSIDVAPSDGTLFLAGDEGALYTSTNGAVWTSELPAHEDQISEDLYGVAVSSDGARIWVGGAHGLLLASSDAGTTWSQTRLGPRDLNDIAREPGGTYLWAVGDGGAIFRSRDNGKRWEPRPSPTPRDLYKVLIAGDGRFWAVGNQVLLTSENRGDTWARHASYGALRPEGVQLWDIAATPDGKDIWIAGSAGRVFRSADYGNNWSSYNVVSASKASSITVSPDEAYVWVGTGAGQINRFQKPAYRYWIYPSGHIGSVSQILQTGAPGELWATSASGTLTHSIDWGANWNSAAIPSTSSLRSIAVAKESGTIVVVGENGTVLVGQPAAPLPRLRRLRLRQNPIAVNLELDLENSGVIDTTLVKLYGATRTAWEQNQWEEIPAYATWNKDAPSLVAISFRPDKFKFSESEPVYFEAIVQTGGVRQRMSMPPLVLRRWAIIKDHLATAVALSAAFAFYLAMSVLLVLRPLAVMNVYRRSGFTRLLEGLPIPILGEVLKALSFGTLLPLLFTHTRVLDAWVRDRKQKLYERTGTQTSAIGDSMAGESAGGASTIASEDRFPWQYMPLPIDIRDNGATRQLREPSPGELCGLLRPEQVALHIVGQGGAGKSTLARELVRCAMNPPPDTSSHPFLAVWIAEETDDLAKSIRDKVVLFLGEEIETEFLKALLRKQRILLVLDGVSERSPVMQERVMKIMADLPANALVVTSRTRVKLLAHSQLEIDPIPLNSETLLTLMTGLLRQWLTRQDGGDSDRKPRKRIPIASQLELGRRLAELASLNGDELPITPLLVRLYVQKAVKLLARGDSIEALPKTVPDVYFDYLKQVNPSSRSADYYLDEAAMIKVCCALGRLALRKSFVPGSFSGWEAEQTLREINEPSGALKRLAANGVLSAIEAGADWIYSFVSDPTAEFLAAFAWAQRCGEDPDQWAHLGEMLRAGWAECEGFRLALALTISTYGAQMRWTPPNGFPGIQELAQGSITRM
jgi:photosystem II stability/assembly factor-like uncharacterized protein